MIESSAKGSSQITDEAELDTLVERVIAENQKSAADFRAGKQPALMFLVGQAMKLSQGRANPARLREVLSTRLNQKS